MMNDINQRAILAARGAITLNKGDIIPQNPSALTIPKNAVGRSNRSSLIASFLMVKTQSLLEQLYGRVADAPRLHLLRPPTHLQLQNAGHEAKVRIVVPHQELQKTKPP